MSDLINKDQILNSIYKSRILCQLCSKIFKKPVKLQCGHIFCACCMENYKKTHFETSKCPTCYLIYKTMEKEPFLDLLSRELLVKCWNPKCNWTGKISEYEDHIRNECEFKKYLIRMIGDYKFTEKEKQRPFLFNEAWNINSKIRIHDLINFKHCLVKADYPGYHDSSIEATRVDNRIYLCGGLAEIDKGRRKETYCVEIMYKQDYACKTKRLCDLKASHAGHNLISFLNEYIINVGFDDNDRNISEIYNIAQNKWKLLPSPYEELRWRFLVIINDRYIFTGRTPPNNADIIIERIDLLDIESGWESMILVDKTLHDDTDFSEIKGVQIDSMGKFLLYGACDSVIIDTVTYEIIGRLKLKQTIGLPIFSCPYISHGIIYASATHNDYIHYFNLHKKSWKLVDKYY